MVVKMHANLYDTVVKMYTNPYDTAVKMDTNPYKNAQIFIANALDTAANA